MSAAGFKRIPEFAQPNRLPFGLLLLGVMLQVTYLMSCGPDTPRQALDQGPWNITTTTEDELVARFAHLMDLHPTDTAAQLSAALLDKVIAQAWDMQVTSSGLYHQVLAEGEGQKPKWGDRVSVHYNGYALDGALFDSSYRRGKPFTFYVGNVIDGWNEALTMIGSGGKIFVAVPSHLGYGAEGFRDLVGPHQHLLFEIALIEILDE